MSRRTISLKSRLLLILGFSLCMLWSLASVWMFVDVHREFRAALDDRLAASARMVAGLMSQFPMPKEAAHGNVGPPLDVIGRDGVACEVSLMRGEVTADTIARTSDSPDLAQAPPGYGTHVYGGRLWRTYVLKENNLRIVTADRIETRRALLWEIALTAIVPFVVALAGSLLTLWFGIGKGLAPLERLRRVLQSRRPEDDAPLPQVGVPAELKPLLATIRSLLSRVRGMVLRERQFTDDAAHELRTPLSAIKVNLQVARLALSQPGALPQAVCATRQAEEGVQRMEHTLGQLLQLARIENRPPGPPLDSGGCDGAHAARLAVDEVLSDPHREKSRSIEIEHRRSPRSARVALPEELLVAALRNLLDNALRYSPQDTAVVLRLDFPENGKMSFCVLDEGPGLSDADIERAPQRFWRGRTTATGSGIGLSIVKAIAERFGCDLVLGARSGGRGLQACLTIPMEDAPRRS